MKVRMRGRIVSAILCLVLACTLAFVPGNSVYAEGESTGAEKNITKRAIYVVFDNSGSMYMENNLAWSQATYAMEVFAAMMNYESGDVMKVFPMHDVTVDGKKDGETTSSIKLSSQKDISKIHDMYTPKPGGTPYTQVNNAAKELNALLEENKADEGWLVVLTDGEFDSDVPGNGLQKDLAGKAEKRDNLYVQFLAMGQDVKNVPNEDPDVGFYSQKAENSLEVVNELAAISNRIFKRTEYEAYEAGTELEFDIPLSKVIVFAQGKDVSINSLKNAEGGEVNVYSSNNVSYSTTTGAGLTSTVTSTPVADKTLKGQICVFKDTSSCIVEGKYALDVQGADVIAVYYEPDLDFEVGFFKGDEEIMGDTIEGGAYILKVGFRDRLSGRFIEKSKLLGEPVYKIAINGEEFPINNNGAVLQEIPFELSGDSIEVAANVVYLNDYIDNTTFSASVCTLEMSVDAPKSVNVKELEDEANALKVTATRNGQPLTEEQWKSAIVSVKALNEEGEEFPVEWEVAHGSKVSTWVISPKYKDNDLYATGTGKAAITIDISAEIDGDPYGSSENIEMKINDDKTILDFLQRYWKEIVISLIIFFIVLGYIPPIKKRFSRRMKKRPSIEGVAEKVGIKDMLVKGNFEKELITVLLPYVPERGKITFSPAPVKKTAKVRSTGGGGMVILNTKAYAGKDEITFNGMSIPDNYQGNYPISASTIIVVSTPEYTYTCIPNVQKTADGSIKKSKGKKGKR